MTSSLVAQTGETLRLSVPGKTFFVGEYLALEGGPSLLISTAPRFELKVRAAHDASVRPQPFAEASPAGLFLRRQEDIFAGVDLDFSDPHFGKGGLGASSAQFALLYAYAKNLKSTPPEDFDWRALLETYRQHSWTGEGRAPSGADVVSQLCGGITWYDGLEYRVKTFAWVFSDLSFTLVRTGLKLATHEHLKVTKPNPDSGLRDIVQKATAAFESGQSESLVQSVAAYAETLERMNLTASTTIEILQALRAEEGLIRAAKGCGAMGADVILVLHDRSKETDVLNWVKRHGLEVCGSRSDLSEGLLVSASNV